MEQINLEKQENTAKIGKPCPAHEPNISTDCILMEQGEPIGFFLQRMPEKMVQLAKVADAEFMSPRVPKTEMSRGPQGNKRDKAQRRKDGVELVTQMSCILGSIAPKPHMKRPYPSMSSVHQVRGANNFVKAMLLLARESEKLIAQIMPEQYKRQKQLFAAVPDQWKFGSLFTSSISNYNISAPFHRDAGNIVGAVNVIITKRRNSRGGNLHVPDYGATFDQKSNSVLVYPAWKNIHGVTPIEPTYEGGYRNSFIFYPLKAFVNKTESK